MKQICYMLIVALSATVLMAGGIDQMVLKAASVNTSSTASVTSSPKIRGWLERIDMTFANTTSTVYLTISASNAMNSIERTLLSVDALATDTSYMPRTPVHTPAGTVLLTNEVTRFPLLDEKIYLSVTGAAYNGQNVQATIIYERP